MSDNATSLINFLRSFRPIPQQDAEIIAAATELQWFHQGDDATTRYRNFVSNQPDVALRVPLSDVASYLGITQQSLSRIRKNIRFQHSR